VVNLELNISANFGKEIRNDPNGMLRGFGGNGFITKNLIMETESAIYLIIFLVSLFSEYHC
jgi:hypothetical protein